MRLRLVGKILIGRGAVAETSERSRADTQRTDHSFFNAGSVLIWRPESPATSVPCKRFFQPEHRP
jgi:hypothetical protein